MTGRFVARKHVCDGGPQVIEIERLVKENGSQALGLSSRRVVAEGCHQDHGGAPVSLTKGFDDLHPGAYRHPNVGHDEVDVFAVGLRLEAGCNIDEESAPIGELHHVVPVISKRVGDEAPHLGVVLGH